GRYICLSVSDSGPGMDSATMTRMLEPFFTTKAVGRGTGLGLATIHGIVREHGGAIDVCSEVGVGTRFAVYVPQTEQSAVGEAEHPQSIIPSGNGETVLLVDDEESLVVVGEDMLASLGYEPVGFDSSAAALAAFHASPDR